MNATAPDFVCTKETCPIDESYFEYLPSLSLNALLLALFSLSLLVSVGQGAWYRTWTFTFAMVCGNICEVLGYMGRVMANSDPFDMTAFLIQICCLTFGPAFFAAGIYLCLSRIVSIYGADISRLRPIRYTQIFISCDFVSLVLQGAGGGMASVSTQNGGSAATGTNVMIAGLAFQVFTLALFMLLCAEYAFRVVTSGRQLNPTFAHLRDSKQFKGFLGMIAFATVCIQIRSVYRLIELSQGWEGALIAHENYFFILEGVMVIAAVLAMNIFHPGCCLLSAWNARANEKDTGSFDTEMVRPGRN